MNWKAECLEQARLNGMGAERELALRAEVERLRHALHCMLSAYPVSFSVEQTTAAIKAHEALKYPVN